jgi:hypothetical protein
MLMYALSHRRPKRMAAQAVLLLLLLPCSPLASDRADRGDFSHATIGCLEGEKAPGSRVILSQEGRCDVGITYPNLDLHLKELPAKGEKLWKFNIGPENWAFRCLSSNDPCEQARSGTVVFDKLSATEEGEHSRPGLHDSGHYELRFKNGHVERGSFIVECFKACG